MSAAGVPRGLPSAGRATAVKKATATAKLSVSGPMREDQKQRHTSAPAWWGWTWPNPPPLEGQCTGQWSSA